jgi:acylpyruvate hydrolase
MRLVTYSKLGVPSIGTENENGDVIDIPDLALRYGKRHQVHGYEFPKTMLDLLEWNLGIEVVQQVLRRYDNTPEDQRFMPFKKSSVKLEAPVQRPSKIMGIAHNYKEHVKEIGEDLPKIPILFTKYSSSVVGPDESIPMPKVSNQIDWEVELGVVIGTQCKDVSEQDALDYIAGYTIINDLSARDIQHGDHQFVRGKSLDGLCPMGPCIVTTDELGDGSGLDLYTKVNGDLKQDSNTSNLNFKVPQLVSFLSQSFTLLPGDIIATGTPSGIGEAREPPEFLKPGDEVELYIEKIGYLRNKIISS